MPWSESYYPRAMAHLSPIVRSKAIEIANALLEAGHDEGFSYPRGDRARPRLGAAAGAGAAGG